MRLRRAVAGMDRARDAHSFYGDEWTEELRGARRGVRKGRGDDERKARRPHCTIRRRRLRPANTVDGA